MSDPGRPDRWTDPTASEPAAQGASPGGPYAQPPFPPGGPYGQPPFPPGGPPAGYGQVSPYRPSSSTNGRAIAALVCGIVGITACPVVGGVAIYLGNRARREIAQSDEQGDGMGLAGIILGWISITLFVLIIVAYAVVIAIAAANGAFST